MVFMRLVFAGTPEVALPSLEALVASDHEVVGVITRADARAGRGRTLVPSPVRARADELGVDVLTATPRDPEFAQWFEQRDVDCVAVVAYGHILPASVLQIPRHGWINLHFSLLPAWRGAAPVQRSIIAGDQITGASTFRIEQGLDSGPVYGMTTETIKPRDTSGDVLVRLGQSGAKLLVGTMDAIADGSIRPIPQEAEGVSVAPKLTPQDAHIPWTLPAHIIDRLIRGCTPQPGAWTQLDGQESRLGIGPSTVEKDSELSLAPGEIHATKRDVFVGTAAGVLRLGDVTPSGKKSMPAADWARGARLESGARFVSQQEGK